MNKNDLKKQRTHETLLRRRAEDALLGKMVDLEGLPTEDIQYLLHELQVHQAELSIQNEDLRQTQMDLEISRDLYSDLYNSAPAGYCTLSAKGRILNANQTLADMLGTEPEKLLHLQLTHFVDGMDQDKLYLHCRRALANHHREESEIRLVTADGERLVVRIESVAARGDPTQLMVMLSDVTQQRRLEIQQQENTAQMQLQRRLLEQSEMERLELARNLHDGPIQSLASLGFSIQILKEILEEQGLDDEANLQQMSEDVKNLMAELRGICNALRPVVLTRLGLRKAIEENMADMRAKHPGTTINVEMSADPNRLPDPIATALYRIYQQALNNIFRHAHASEVFVRIMIEPIQVIFEIQDNGQGMQSQGDWNQYLRDGHLGLVGMKERAEAVGGRLELVSQPGQGTTVRVVVPAQEVSSIPE